MARLVEKLWLAALALAFAVVAGALVGVLVLPLDATFGFVKGDDWDVQLTMVEAAARAWRAGVLPTWNPWTAGGVPLLANPEAPALHPVALLAAFIPVQAAVRLNLAAHLGVLALGVALWTRTLDGSRLASLVAVAGLASSDFLFWKIGVGHVMMVQCAWVPLALWAVAHATSPGRGGLGAALAVAAAAYGGGPQLAWFGVLATGAWVGALALRRMGLLGPVSAFLGGLLLSAGLARPLGLLLATTAGALLAWRSRPVPLPVLDRLRAWTWTVVLASLLVAPRWLPAALGLGGGERFAWPGSMMANGVYSGMEGLGSLFLHASWSAIPRVDGMHNGLPAFFTPLLAVLALAGAWTLRRSRPEVAAVALFFGVASFGHNLPLNLFAMLHPVPPLDRFRHPERFALVWAPLLCVLAGVGAHAVARRLGRAGWPLLGVLVAAHLWLTVPEALALTRLAPGTMRYPPRQALAAPTTVRGAALTNFECLRLNLSCGDCRDAVVLPAPAGLAEGPWAARPPATLLAWSPGGMRLRLSGTGPVVLPVAARPGWGASGANGQPLPVGQKEGLLTIDGGQDAIRVAYRPPGLWLGAALALAGLAIGAVVGRHTSGCVSMHNDRLDQESSEQWSLFDRWSDHWSKLTVIRNHRAEAPCCPSPRRTGRSMARFVL